MKTLQRLLWEPLLQFLVLGGLIFALYSAMSEPAPPPMNVITIGPARIEQLSKSYQAVWRHPPSTKELDGILENEIRDEVYYREALALGLDTNDMIVRRRLRQKMEFLSDSGAGLLEPPAGELEDYLLANEERFRIAPRLTFEQIFLGRAVETSHVERSLRALQDADPGVRPELGVRSMLPSRMDLSTPQSTNAVFGEDFFAGIEELPNEKWVGPIESTYGVHLVWLEERVEARPAQLEEIRPALLLDWKAAKAREVRELHFAKLRERYVVEIRLAEPAAATEAVEEQ
jgi:hypothetical protein